MPNAINMVDRDGRVKPVSEDQIAGYVAQGWQPETPEAGAERVTKEHQTEKYGGVSGKATALAAGLARGVSGGVSDVVLPAVLGDDARRDLAALKEEHPILSTVGDVGGAVAGAVLTGGSNVAGEGASLGARAAMLSPSIAAARAGQAIRGLGEGAGLVGRAAATIGGGAAEGALFGVGGGITNLALSDDPLTAEHAISVLSSHALYGAGVGAVAGTLAKGAEIGLGKARTALAEHAALSDTAEALPRDLAALDGKGLRAAEADEVAKIRAERVTQKQQFVDDLTSFRNEVQQQKPWLATKGLTDEVVGAEAGKVPVQEIGAMSNKADTAIRNLLNNPKRLAENISLAKGALQQQEHALEQMLTREQALRGTFAADETGTRAAALDMVPAVLEKNRALQQKIVDLTSDVSSPRLQAIADAKDALASGGAKAGSVEQMVSGLIFGKAHAAAAAIGTAVGGPVGGLLGLVAPFVGAKASKLVTEKVFGRIAGASADAAQRSTKAIEAFLGGATKATKVAAPLATKVLASVRYAPRAPASKAATEPARALSTAFQARATEIRSQTTPGPTGAPVIRTEARAAIAHTLSPIAAASPLLADRMETAAVAKLEFLAGKLPQALDMGMQLGPKRDTTGEMQMREFARYAAAVEDPHGVVERLATGQVTPEDSEAMRAVYPEMMADITRQIIEQLPKLRDSLPFNRRVALSIFSGVAVDPALDPGVLAVLQGQFEVPDSGPPGATAQPQFGSVKKSVPEPTPAQSRAG